MTTIPSITTERLSLETFATADSPALAAILAEPEVTRNITANGSTPERCLASAQFRIAWHNKAWHEHGYGVWAIRARNDEVAPKGALLGWCGFAEPDIGEDPEILYGLAPAYWGHGLAQEAVRAAIGWLFTQTPCSGVSAIIFGRLNPISIAIAQKLGMTRRGTMSMEEFLPDLALARDVLDYEIWRLAEGRCLDSEALLFQAPYKGGQIATLGLAEPGSIEQEFLDAARARGDYATIGPLELDRRVRDAFRLGMGEPHLDWYHLPRSAWPPGR